MSRFSTLFTGDKAPEPANGQGAKEPVRYRLLLVDDEPNVLKALQRVFRMENYEVATATNADDALRLLSQGEFQVVISDYKMPGLTGAELLRRVKNTYPDVIRIMLTGHADSAAVMGAINEGAVYKFILKPWNDDDLRVTVALAIEQYDLIKRNRQLTAENEQKNREIKALTRLAVTNRSQLAIMLHKKGMLNEHQVQELYKLQQVRKEPTIKLLLEKEWVTEKAITTLLRKELLLDEVALPEFQVDQVVAELVPKSFCQRQLVVPLKLSGRRLMLAVADPLDEGMLNDLRFVSGMEIQPVLASVSSIKTKIDQIYGGLPSITELESIVAAADPYESIEIVIEDEDSVSVDELLHSTEEPPAIRLVNAILTEAVRLNVSDIHIQPRTKHIVVRYRIDGILYDKIQVPHALFPALVSRLKVMAEMDIAERRRPQDGRITVKTPLRIVDVRISTLPTITGEKVVMRILDRNAAIHRIEDLGFSERDQVKVLSMVGKPQGIVLATGPTGSGKTTTLYSLLQHNATPGKNYVTIEDPVEFFLDMAGQVLVKEKIGLTFPVVLRSILRQDPDVVLLGEIRDFETAEVAFHAALTGHLVFSTLHTNSAVATVARLYDLGLKPYVIATAIEGIIAQRLVRRICQHCKEPAQPDPMLMRQLGPAFDPRATQTFIGRGCSHCNESGYKGRIGLYEVLVPDEHLRDMIGSSASILDLRKYAEQNSITTLIDDARLKVIQGQTTVQEVLRVLGPQTTL